MKNFALIIGLLMLAPAVARAQTAPAALNPDVVAQSLLQDTNGDGVIDIAAFGDSITRGEGDFISPDSHVEVSPNPNRPEQGYPLRIESYLGIGVRNWGFSGEDLTEGGVARFINLVVHTRPDVVIIAEGSNDARIPASPSTYGRAIQTMINVAKAVGTTPVLSTIVPSCCDHQFLNPFLATYNNEVRTRAIVNDLVLADPHHAFSNTCDVNNCRLLNRPEGLHPNIEGYDVMGEVMISTLLKINLFAPDGPTLLSQALGVPVESIKTVPDPLPPS
ncbi:MAG: SGNH/GDSL hydrolase family protein [Bdellovibrionota bacterium]